MTSHESTTSGGHDDPSTNADSLSAILARVYGRLVADPALAAPLVVAGLVVTLLDELRRRDPIPARPTEPTDGTEFSIDILLTPTGSQATTRTLGGLVDLQPRLLAWALGLELLGTVVVALAGYYTIARTLDSLLSATSAGMYLLYASFGYLLGAPAGVFVEIQLGVGLGALLFLLPLFVGLVFVGIRLFAVPAALVDGHGVRAAVRQSNSAVRGRGWAVFGVVVVLSVLSWVVGAVPVGSTLLSFALVVSSHALATAVVYEPRTASA